MEISELRVQVPEEKVLSVTLHLCVGQYAQVWGHACMCYLLTNFGYGVVFS